MNYVSQAKTLQTEIARLLRNDDIKQIAEKYDQLDALYREMSGVVQEIKLIRQNCNTEIISRLRKIRCDVEILDNDAPTAAEIQQLQLRDHGTREVAPGISLPVITVPTEDFIPDSQLYYIRSTDEFGVRINGTLIHGCVRDISQGQSSIKCRAGAACRVARCPWGHPSSVTDEGGPRTLQTWSPGTWIYTDRALKKENVHMRHIGNRGTLLPDIAAATRVELATRAQQTAHDLLVQLAVDHVNSE